MDALLHTLLHGDELTVAVVAGGGDVGPQPGSTITKVLNDIMTAHTGTARHQGGFYRVGIPTDVLAPVLKILLALCNCGHPGAFAKADALLSAHGLGEPVRCDLEPADEVAPGPAPSVFGLPRGVVHNIGTRGRTRPFTNPVRARTLSITWRGAHNANGGLGPDRLADLGGACECFTANAPGAWAEWDFGEDRRVAATGYALRHGAKRDHWLLREWVLEATNHPPGMGERRRWHVLSRHHDDRTLAGSYGAAYWRLGKQAWVQDFRCFRVRQTGPNSHGPNSHAMYLSGLELYGTLLRRAGSGDEASAADNFYPGLVVEARYCGRPKWSMGRVAKAHLDGSFDVEYEDGDLNRVERNVHPAVMRYPVAVAVGTAVERRRWDTGPWRNGRVTAVNLDGTCNVVFDDRSRDERVKRSALRLPDDFWRGQTVEVLARAYWWLGRILDQHKDGTFDVAFLGDGKKERFVARERLRQAGPVAVGTSVLARYRGSGGWFPATVTSTLDDEDEDGDGGLLRRLYALDYEDGAEEKAAPREMLRVSFEVDLQLQAAAAEAAADEEVRRKEAARRVALKRAEDEEVRRVEAEMRALLGDGGGAAAGCGRSGGGGEGGGSSGGEGDGGDGSTNGSTGGPAEYSAPSSDTSAIASAPSTETGSSGGDGGGEGVSGL